MGTLGISECDTSDVSNVSCKMWAELSHALEEMAAYPQSCVLLLPPLPSPMHRSKSIQNLASGGRKHYKTHSDRLGFCWFVLFFSLGVTDSDKTSLGLVRLWSMLTTMVVSLELL